MYKKTKSKYHTLFELITHEKVYLSDFEEWQQKRIKQLNKSDLISISPEGLIIINLEKAMVLKDLYEHDVICLYDSQSPSMVSPVIKKMIFEGDLRVESRLFSEPERDYLNYALNKSEFCNGLDLRNRYIHGTYPKDENEQRKDYITLLRLMVLIVTKINDEFCALDVQKGNSKGISDPMYRCSDENRAIRNYEI